MAGGDDGSSTDNRIDAERLSGTGIQAQRIRDVDARRTNNFTALSMALGVAVTLLSFVVWRFAGADESIAGHPITAPSTAPTTATTGSAPTRPDKAGVCIEEHLDKAPAVLGPSRYQFPVDVQASRLMTGDHKYPIAGTLVRDGRTVGAIKLFYEFSGTGLQVLEVVDASCAAIEFTKPKKVAEDSYRTTFQIAGQAYEVEIVTPVAIFLDVTFRLASN